MAEPSTIAARRGRDLRVVGLVVTVLLVAGGGYLLDRWINDSGEPGLKAHVDQKRKEEIDIRFKQGVIMLHAKEYEHAMTAFSRVLDLAPGMPEAHANMGFAMIGVQRYPAARDFFNAATELNVNQLNAYYGLALALEGLNDLPGAMGAMQTYMHLSRADDPFRAKAENALQKWRAVARPAPN